MGDWNLEKRAGQAHGHYTLTGGRPPAAAPQPKATEVTCCVCKKTIEAGTPEVVSPDDDSKLMHPACFCCSACHKPLTSAYLDAPGGGGRIHSTCLKCAKCNKGLGDEYFEGPGGKAVCGACA